MPRWSEASASLVVLRNVRTPAVARLLAGWAATDPCAVILTGRALLIAGGAVIRAGEHVHTAAVALRELRAAPRRTATLGADLPCRGMPDRTRHNGTHQTGDRRSFRRTGSDSTSSGRLHPRSAARPDRPASSRRSSQCWWTDRRNCLRRASGHLRRRSWQQRLRSPHTSGKGSARVRRSSKRSRFPPLCRRSSQLFLPGSHPPFPTLRRVACG
jgi:hypothetical protein